MGNGMRTVAVIPNYNGREYLGACIEGLLAQEPAPGVVLVDNCSTDGSADFTKENYPAVRVIEMEKNTGFATAVNRGIRETDHEYIALVNNDAVVQPGWLAALEGFLDETPGAGACAPKVLFHTDGDIIDSAGDECTPYGYNFKRGHFEKDEGQYDETRETFSVSAVATLYRRSMFDDIGMFDENFFAYYEDLDLCFRGRLAGRRFYCVPSALALHRYSATSGSQMKLGTEEVYANLTATWVKDAPAGLLLKHLPSVVVFHSAVMAGVALARLRGNARLPRVAVCRLMWRMLGQRRGVQKSRVAPIGEIESRMARVGVWKALGSRVMKSLGRK